MKKKRRRGGQRKPAAVRKRNNLTFRTRDQLRDQLERAAATTGRSISEEIEHRLTMSLFGEDDRLRRPRDASHRNSDGIDVPWPTES